MDLCLYNYSLSKNNSDVLKNKLLNNNNLIDNKSVDNNIPYNIYQTYYNKKNIPNEIYDNINQFAPEYKHYIYDDNECIEFLDSYFNPIVLDTFFELESGAHKADLIRYCLLYIYGGIYIDIKTELIKPISEIFTKLSTIYCTVDYRNTSVYQGIIAAPKMNNFFLKLINYIVDTRNPQKYLDFCNDFYNNIFIETSKEIKPGEIIGKNNTFYLFKEKCSQDGELCYDGLDRYGMCCFIYDNKEPIIKSRRASYPW